MPYKNKEDRTAAVKRYREKKINEQLYSALGDKVDTSLSSILEALGFQEVNFNSFVESCQGAYLDGEEVWHDKQGHTVFPPKKMFFGRNTMIAGDHFDDQINAFASLLQCVWDGAEMNKTRNNKPE